MTPRINRREFLKLPLAGAIAVAVPSVIFANELEKQIKVEAPIAKGFSQRTPVRALYQYSIAIDAHILRLDVLSSDGKEQLHVDVGCYLSALRDPDKCAALLEPIRQMLRETVQHKKITQFAELAIPPDYRTDNLVVLPSYLPL